MARDIANFTNNEVSLLAQGPCKDLNTQELNLFEQACKSYRLDPFRGELVSIVFGKNNPDASKRKMQLIITRAGYRRIASDCGNYRPKSKPAIYVYDESAKDNLNPLGIVSCGVVLYQQDAKNPRDWHEVYGEAYWDEFRVIDPWKKDQLADQWQKMPRLMIEKCAESMALRAGWPSMTNGLYTEEEFGQQILDDKLASEKIIEHEEEKRNLAIQHSKSQIAIDMPDGLQFIEADQYHDTWCRLMKDYEEKPAVLMTLYERNTESLKRFWAHDKPAALDLKGKFEKIIEAMEADAAEDDENEPEPQLDQVPDNQQSSLIL